MCSRCSSVCASLICAFKALLATNSSFDNSILDNIISQYISKCETEATFPWNYYYVKYPIFRPGSYGKMSNPDWENKPYMFSVMQTKTQISQNTYMPYLKAVDNPNDEHMDRDALGQRLMYSDRYITCDNDSYVVYGKSDDAIIEVIVISQDENNIDVEDRILKLKAYVDKIM